LASHHHRAARRRLTEKLHVGGVMPRKFSAFADGVISIDSNYPYDHKSDYLTISARFSSCVEAAMQKPTKLILGIATLSPIAYLFLFFVFMLSTFLNNGGTNVALFLGLHLFTMLFIAALTVFYIVDIFRNDRVAKDQKALWAIVIFMGNAIAMPIYWYLYFW